ncbi:MAG: 3-methyladenine DNA glycosylase [Chloroflexi bacterium ADurb.Bin325]|nr:MAG: 3-methyladenine DNA glycosylase [Chloroflexi bacterium ADurb.Bin325]
MTARGARLSRAFYERPTPVVARALLGQRLVRVLAGSRLSGLICETEAYGGPDDESSHAFRRTPRSAIMYGAAGYAYVYYIYGMHYCLNVVTEPDGRPGAVLIRAIFPQEGVGAMRERRGPRGAARLADGPGKLCRALAIDLAQNGLDLATDAALFIEAGEAAAAAEVRITPRIGVRGGAEARERPWRFVWTPLTAPAAPAS